MVHYAEDRSCTTQFELGQMFHDSDDRVRDYEQAFNWYRRSARKGYRRAQHCLGSMYASGQGVAKNSVKAYAWCKVAASQHSQNALNKLREIESGMTAEQIFKARKLARLYYEMYVAANSSGSTEIK